mmetsp:Transcript_1553/g.3215  ORF Transcript_1553/g.3215 Transcript_1553/m.3215 type:complete len:483 (+) Transcript_1553:63-1511(+)
MIQYNNSIPALKLILQIYGSVIPRVLPWCLLCSGVGFIVALHRHSPYLPLDNVIGDHFGIQVYAMVLGYVVVFRTNMALSRYMEGISQVQIMLSKWGDAFLQLVAFANASAESLDMEGKMQLLRFRCRQAHWFALMSAFAMLSLQQEGETPEFEELQRKLRVKPEGAHDVSTGLIYLEDLVPPTIWELVSGQHPQKRRNESHDNMLWIFHALTSTEQDDLRGTPDRVCSIAEWIVESAMEEWHKGNLLTPPPILSRCFQEISNASFGFNQAWKIARVPFPLPFAQILALTMVGLVIITPFAIDQFTNSYVLTPIFCFLVVMGYLGLNMIAVELENPFGGDSNDLPLTDVHNAFVEFLEDLSVQISVGQQPDLVAVEDRIWSRRWHAWAEIGVVPRETPILSVDAYCKREADKLTAGRDAVPVPVTEAALPALPVRIVQPANAGSGTAPERVGNPRVDSDADAAAHASASSIKRKRRFSQVLT